jgi:hypothetical protein
MARVQNALSSVTERFQGFEQFRAVSFTLCFKISLGGGETLLIIRSNDLAR